MDPLGHFREYVEKRKPLVTSVVRAYNGNYYYHFKQIAGIQLGWFRMWSMPTTSEWTVFGEPLMHQTYLDMAIANYKGEHPFDAVGVYIGKFGIPDNEALMRLYSTINCSSDGSVDLFHNSLLARKLCDATGGKLSGVLIENVLRNGLDTGYTIEQLMNLVINDLFIGFDIVFPKVVDKKANETMVNGVAVFILVDSGLISNPYLLFNT